MFDRLQTVLKTLQARHERRLAIRALSMLNDHQLADIGVERGFVVDAVDGRLPQLEAQVRGTR